MNPKISNKFEGFTIPSQLFRASSLSDYSLSLNFHTSKEVTPEDVANIFQFRNKSGHLVFSSTPVSEIDIPKFEPEVQTKTPSQRLRASLFVLWDQEGRNGDFEVYYRAKMEKLIDFIKGKLI